MTREEAIAIFKGFKFLPREMKAVEMAIKALEQEPCTDAISRQAAIVALDDRMSSLENVDMQIAMGFAKGIIHGLPPVTPTEKVGQWIPVSQPPEKSGEYLVSMRYVTHDVVAIASYATDLHRVDKYDFPKHEAGWYNYDSEYGYYKIENVIVAYMPLPESYKASPTGAERSE